MILWQKTHEQGGESLVKCERTFIENCQKLLRGGKLINLLLFSLIHLKESYQRFNMNWTDNQTSERNKASITRIQNNPNTQKNTKNYHSPPHFPSLSLLN